MLACQPDCTCCMRCHQLSTVQCHRNWQRNVNEHRLAMFTCPPAILPSDPLCPPVSQACLLVALEEEAAIEMHPELEEVMKSRGERELNLRSLASASTWSLERLDALAAEVKALVMRQVLQEQQGSSQQEEGAVQEEQQGRSQQGSAAGQEGQQGGLEASAASGEQEGGQQEGVLQEGQEMPAVQGYGATRTNAQGKDRGESTQQGGEELHTAGQVQQRQEPKLEQLLVQAETQTATQLEQTAGDSAQSLGLKADEATSIPGETTTLQPAGTSTPHGEPGLGNMPANSAADQDTSDNGETGSNSSSNSESNAASSSASTRLGHNTGSNNKLDPDLVATRPVQILDAINTVLYDRHGYQPCNRYGNPRCGADHTGQVQHTAHNLSITISPYNTCLHSIYHPVSTV